MCPRWQASTYHEISRLQGLFCVIHCSLLVLYCLCVQRAERQVRIGGQRGARRREPGMPLLDHPQFLRLSVLSVVHVHSEFFPSVSFTLF